MELNKIYNEPCLETLKRMPDNFLDSVITSPPYWQLRDYGYEGQWGLEPTFDLYLEHLWSMMDEIYRVLNPAGTAWINLGDTYGTQSGNMRNPVPSYETRHAKETIKVMQPKSIHKSLLLLPHRFAIGCIDRGWIIRNDCIWAKRNGMPESVTDRFSKKHEYFFFMVKSEKYYFDLDSIRDKFKNVSIQRISQNIDLQNGSSKSHEGGYKTNGNMKAVGDIEKGKNPGSVSDFWDIPTKGSKEKHYASYNDSLLVKPVLAGCPEGGIIYDPFMGTGSTAEVALRSKRLFIGSEMSNDYIQIAEKRLEPFISQTKLF